MVSFKDIYNDIERFMHQPPKLITTSWTPVGQDVSGYESTVVTIDVGAIGDTLAAGTKQFDIKLQDSPDNSTWTDVSATFIQYGTASEYAVTAGHVVLTSTATDQNKIYKLGYRGSQRYVQAVITVTGTMSTGTVMGVGFDCGNYRHNPVPAQ